VVSWWLLLLATLQLSAAGVLAQDEAASEAVFLSVADCAGAEASAITRLATLELAARGVRAVFAADEELARVELRCAGELARIALIEPQSVQSPWVLALSLAETRMEARARLLALTLAELVATRHLERTTERRAPAASEAGAESSPASDRAPLTAADRLALSVGVAAGGVLGLEPRWVAPALQLMAAAFGGVFGVQGDVEATSGARSLAEARVSARSISVALVPRLLVAAGSHWRWDVGVGIRGGLAWLGAEARSDTLSGRTVRGLFWAPLVQSAVSFELGAGVMLRAGVELGYVAKPVRGLDATGQRLLELSGMRASALLGVSFAL
jgi:hypothetical protein